MLYCMLLKYMFFMNFKGRDDDRDNKNLIRPDPDSDQIKFSDRLKPC